MLYMTEFRVQGKGSFPFDMLRYDHAIPASDGDAQSVGATREDYAEAFDKPRIVELRRLHGSKYGADHVTRERWLSFGWVVVEVRSPYQYS